MILLRLSLFIASLGLTATSMLSNISVKYPLKLSSMSGSGDDIPGVPQINQLIPTASDPPLFLDMFLKKSKIPLLSLSENPKEGRGYDGHGFELYFASYASIYG